MDPTIPDAMPHGTTSGFRAAYQVQDIIRLLRRRWKLVAGVALVFVIGAVGVTMMRPKVYAAHSTLLIKPTNQSDVFNPQQDQFGEAQRRIATESAVVKSSAVAQLVTDKLGSAPPVTVSGSATADIITITARNSDRKKAMDIANAYAQAYLDAKRKEDSDDLQAAMTPVRAKINDLQGQMNALDKQVADAPPSRQYAVSAAIAP